MTQDFQAEETPERESDLASWAGPQRIEDFNAYLIIVMSANI